MAPLQPWAAPASQHSRNCRRGLLQQEGGGGGGGGSSAGKRTAGIHPPARSASFHGKTASTPDQLQRHQIMRRPKTQPDLLAAAAAPGGCSSKISSPVEAWRLGDTAGEQQQQLRRVPAPAKVLVNVNVQRSLGALQVMASTDWTVAQLIAASIKQYVKEGRRPPLPSTDPSAFGLHYSQFSLQCLDPNEKLIGLGSRNFFLCPKPTTGSLSPVSSALSSTTAQSASAPIKSSSSPDTLPAASSSCSKEAVKASKIAIPWLRFMDFLL